MASASMGMLGTADRLAAQALSLWGAPDGASARRINVAENVTYLVEALGWRSVLRVHRPEYHSRRAIECELAWSSALRESGLIKTPSAIPGRNGHPVQELQDGGMTRHLVMFEFVEGSQPDESSDLRQGFNELGRIAAQTHLHSLGWQRPDPFERLSWDLDTIFGAEATWGDWRDAPNVTADVRQVLDEVEATVRRRLDAFGKDSDRYGLIHADMRLANLLIGPGGTQLIDFDDCGFGWYLYDFAAGISFIEDHPQVTALKEAWVRGYRSVRSLPAEDEAEIDTFIMLRRLALLAWIGSHMEATEPQALAPHFARVSAGLGEAYLRDFG
ncbi:MAG: phosphotransferase [Pseudomonadota bacterium]